VEVPDVFGEFEEIDLDLFLKQLYG